MGHVTGELILNFPTSRERLSQGMELGMRLMSTSPCIRSGLIACRNVRCYGTHDVSLRGGRHVGSLSTNPVNHKQEINHPTHCISCHNVGTSPNPQAYEVTEPVNQRLHNTVLCTTLCYAQHCAMHNTELCIILSYA